MENNVMIIKNVRAYQDNRGIAQLNLEDVARGLGFVEHKNGIEYIMWRRVNSYLKEFGFGTSVENPFIPENIFYKLCFKAKNEIARKFQDLVTDEILPRIRQTGNYDMNTNLLLKQLTDSQVNTNALLVGFKAQIDSGFQKTNDKLSEHDELLRKRVYLSTKEAKDVQDAVKNKAKQIAVDNELNYFEVRSALFKRLYTKLNDKFEVASYRELPSVEFEKILNTIKNLKISTKDLKEDNNSQLKITIQHVRKE